MNKPLTPAEIAAEGGTVGGCWESYCRHVLRASLAAVGMPRTATDFEKGARLDYYAGSAAVFMILRAKFAQGIPPTANVLIELEREVMAFLEATRQRGLDA